MKDFLKMVFGSCLGVILASVVVFFIFFSMLSSAIGGVMENFKDNKEVKKVDRESVLLLDLNGAVNDTAITDPFSDVFGKDQKTFTLPEILKAIEVARDNSDIEAIVLNLENAGINYANARELRDALKYFQESGKKVYAFSDHYSFLNYYISSVADEVIGGPEGSLYISGITYNTLFTKGLLEKLGIDIQVFKVGTFKSAVEPFTMDKMSDANRLQVMEYINGLWQGTTTEMAESRGIGTGIFQSFADEARFLDKAIVAKDLGLLDTLVYRIDLDKVLARKIYNDESTEINYLRVGDLLPHYKNSGSDNGIAVIYAEGNIVVGTGNDEEDYFSSQALINEKVVKQLREAAENDDIKAVVMRVNSGGGAVTTSELICHEVELLKQKKPIVISMGDYAASGGYYISSHASKIVANPYTLTGSIGIFGMIPNFKGTMQKLGLKQETLSTSETGTFNGTDRMTGKLAEGMQRAIERGYDEFTGRVATGRGITKAQVDSIGQGRIWLGNKAMELGLVDMMGGLNTAIQEAARLAELDDYRVMEIKEDKDWFKDLFGFSLPRAAKLMMMTQEERIMLRAESYIKQFSGIQALPPYDITAVGEAARETKPFLSLK
ncbi:MAG: signal peptide peptidase SppA [Bacteroidales bacterium]|uniref:signal peptide peptidase SppA n=1 Tax=Porphyromonas sp. TaxID=1924944 RepID=UPI0029793E63|nr:signal peptide peptidase SppA [Porphyromonas sp.]MDD7437851.1 signal peptide peptidase SppA [Bacteroidales bacterium]MDY3067736.1 signal peptide peptidase SppA [Porphyromonas sp.]